MQDLKSRKRKSIKGNKILLTDNIELILKDHIGNLANEIEAKACRAL